LQLKNRQTQAIYKATFYAKQAHYKTTLTFVNKLNIPKLI